MTERKSSEALEKLNRGIEESRRAAQRQGMQATQEYFGDFIESLKQQVSESRSNLEGLPEQVPGGQEDSFQSLFRELMSGYTKVEDCLEQARKNVDGLDLDSLGREQARPPGQTNAETAEVEASETAQREAEELGLDITRIRGTGSEGRVVAEDVKRAAGARKKAGAAEESREAVRDRKYGEPRATAAARREAAKLGVDLSEVEATGAEGQVIVSDVVEFAENRGRLTPESPAGSGEGGLSPIDRIEEASKTANGQVDQSADEPVSGELLADGSTEDVSPEEAVRQIEDAATGAAGEAVQEPPRVTSAARRKAEDLGLDLSRVEGSGAGGLVTIKDVVGASR